MNRPRIIIECEGGVVHRVASDTDTDVIIVDLDANTHGEPDDLVVRLDNGQFAYRDMHVVLAMKPHRFDQIYTRIGYKTERPMNEFDQA